jgi:hypothetical protein
VLHLGEPDATEQGWIGQDAVLRQLLACWLVVDPSDRPLAPRLTGPRVARTTCSSGRRSRTRSRVSDNSPEDQSLSPGTPVATRPGRLPLRGPVNFIVRQCGGREDNSYEVHTDYS